MALHDANGDTERAIMYLLEQGDVIETEWKTSGPKKKPKNKSQTADDISKDSTPRSASLDVVSVENAVAWPDQCNALQGIII